MPAHQQLSAQATRDHSITQILLSQNSVKDIKAKRKRKARGRGRGGGRGGRGGRK